MRGHLPGIPVDLARPEMNRVSGAVVGAAYEVHRHLGPGLLERIYRVCLKDELQARGHRVVEELPAPVVYKGKRLEAGYRIDLLVEGCVIVEVKAVQEVLPVHKAQLITYLTLTGCPIGLLINFNEPTIKEGVQRFVGSTY